MKGKWLTALICILLLIFGIVVGALVQKRAKIPALIDQLGTEDYGDAQDAMRELVTMRELVVQPVCAVLNPDDRLQTDARRWRAAMVLGEIGGKNAVEVLLTALRTFEAKDVRWNCMVALGKLRAAEAVPDLIAAFPDDEFDTVVRLTAIRTLGILGAKEAVEPLTSQLERRPDAQQVTAERRQEEREAREAKERAEKRTEYEDAGRPVPEELLEDEEEEEEAAEITDADRPELRIACCDALAMIGNRSDAVLAALRQAADRGSESEYAVRAAATIALADLADPGDAAVVDVLVQNLEDEQWDMNANDEDDDADGDLRVAAAYALGRLGNGEQRVMDELRKAADDKHYWVREAAAEAIKQLGGRVESE